MANIPEFISVLRRIRDEIYPEVEEMYENTATLKGEAELSKNAAAASAVAAASSAGIATTRANEIKNVSAQANTLSSGSVATVSYNSIDGKFTFGLPVGAKGDKGESYTINASGTTAGRAAYDTQLIGFSYLDISLSIVYFKLSVTPGDWSIGTSFGRGEDGDDGADGTGIASIAFYSTTSDNGLASQPGGIDTYRITLSNSNTYDISLTNGSDLNINGYSDKIIPKDDDEFAIADSDSYFNVKKLSIKNLKYSLSTGFKNYIINGNFDIWQRGGSQTSNGYGSDDRWFNENNISTKTHSLVNSTDTERALFNSSKFSRTTCVTGGTETSLTTKITKVEDVTKLAGKTVTLSFWAKADSNRNIAIDFQQMFGTGGSPSAIYTNGGQLVALTSTWQKKSITITLPSSIGKTLGTDGVHTSYTRIAFWFEAGSSWSPTYIPTLGTQSGTFDIAQVQLEEGSVATPFENRPIGLELSLCQRYCRRYTSVPIGAAFTDQRTYSDGVLDINMRVVPSLSNASFGTEGIPGILYGDASRIAIYSVSKSWNVNDVVIFSGTLSAEL